MCNLYSVTTGQAAIREAFRAVVDRTGNLPPLPGIFPDQMAPVVRNGSDGRELAMLRWGFPSPPSVPGNRPVTNIRNTASSFWRAWMKPEHRVLVPVSSFCEFIWTSGLNLNHPRAERRTCRWLRLKWKPRPSQRCSINWGDHVSVVASFVRFLNARRCSPNTIVAYLYDLRFLYAYLSSAGITIEQFDTARSANFMAYLADRQRGTGGRRPSTPALVSDRLSPATINRVLAAVSTFYEHLVLTRTLPIIRNPLEIGGDQQRGARRTRPRSTRLRRIQRVPRPLSDEQVAKLLATPTRLRDRAMLLLLLQGGIRVGELLNLHLDDVQYGRRRIIVRYRSDHPRGVRTKSRCERFVDLLEPEALAALSDYVTVERPHDTTAQHLFLVGGRGCRRSEPLGYDAFVKLFRRLRTKAGLSENWITPHTLRHTHATRLWDGGMRELALQKRLGHASLNATRAYTLVSDAGMLADYHRALTVLERRRS